MTFELLIPGRFAPSYVYGKKELLGGGIPRLTRKVWCLNCKLEHGLKTELAKEAGERGRQADEWWSIRPDGSWVSGKWWGNKVTCPVCKIEGRLPQDKPLMEEE